MDSLGEELFQIVVEDFTERWAIADIYTAVTRGQALP